MTPFRAIALLSAAAFGLSLASATAQDDAQDKTSPSPPPSQLIEKLNAYVGCINRLSERSYESRNRYFSWAKKTGPTGKERIIYGTYTIYDTSDCKKNVEKANALEPRDADLEAAASAYAEAVGTLEPLLKEADEYDEQENYKDDKMAKGKALHPRLVAAWDAFASADKKLRTGVEAIKDKQAAEQLAALEAKEGRKVRYHVEALMIHAKRLLRDHGGAGRIRGRGEGGRRGLRQGRRREARLFFHEQRQVIPDNGEATDAPRPRQGALQPGRPHDARWRRRLDGRGLAAAAAPRLQPVDRELQPRRHHLSGPHVFLRRRVVCAPTCTTRAAIAS